MNRRKFLRRAGAVGALGALAGCRDLVRTETPTESPTRTPRESPTATPTPPEERTETTTGSPTPAPDVERPVVFNDPAKIRVLREKVSAGEQPWARAYESTIRDADRALNASPRSVVDNGAPAGVDDAHKYGTDAPYQEKDGVFSDNIDRGDYQAALDMKDWIRDAALGYLFTGEDRYARKAIDLLHTWFVDPETRMYPSTINYGPATEGLKGQNSIEHYIFLPAMLYGAALLDDHPYWEETDGDGSAAVREWVESARDTLESGAHGGTEGDEISKWWIATRILVAAYLDDVEGMRRAAEDWRTTALQDFDRRGTFELERSRSRGLYYSLSAMNALTVGAEIARHYGIDLYGHTLDGMSTPVLQKCHQFHAKYLADPSEWPWEERGGLDDGETAYGAVSYELCYSRWQREGYLNAIEAAGRPVHDRRILGYVTLTHGNLHELSY